MFWCLVNKIMSLLSILYPMQRINILSQGIISQIISLQGHKLLIIGTTSRKDVLQEMEILNVFHTLVHVSSITSSEHLINVVENIDAFTSNEVEQLKKKTTGKRYLFLHLLSFQDQRPIGL